MSYFREQFAETFAEVTATAARNFSPTSLESALPISFAQLDPSKSLSLSQIRAIVASIPSTEDLNLTQELLLKCIVLRINCLVQESLFERVANLQDENLYWARVESSSLSTAVLLLQTTPFRLGSLAATTISRLRQITSQALDPSAPFSFTILRQALPSLTIVSLFPRLSSSVSSNALNLEVFSSGIITQRLMMITTSPLQLAKKEISEIRRNIGTGIDSLADKIGVLAMSEKKRGKMVEEDTIEGIRISTRKTLKSLNQIFGSTLIDSDSSSLEIIHHLLSTAIPASSNGFNLLLSEIQRPSLLARSWPYLVAGPLITISLSKQIYASRAAIQSLYSDSKEILRGFMVDWVLEPIKNILKTVRHRDVFDGRESLQGELDSLERMVLDFGRDEYGMSGAQLDTLRERVQRGDLTDVLKVWEADIKKPIRSAIGGTLIRTLLIQIQKGKVDGALAMEGIQKLMNSQELTFGFIGVAPSMLILFGVSKWIRGLLTSSGGKKARELEKRNLFLTLRQLDLIISPSILSPTQAQGFLLLSLDSLRSFADSKYFPRDSQLRELFLEDVRSLENSGEADEARKRILLERIRKWC